MKKMRAAALLIAVMLALAGCGSSNGGTKQTGDQGETGPASSAPASSGEKQTLSILITTDWVKDETKNLIKQFEEKENVKVDLQIVPGGDPFAQFVQTKINAGEAPDVIYWYSTKSNLKKIQAEKNLVDLSGEPWVADIIDTAKDAVTLNGKVYEYPFAGANAFGLFYNKTVLEQYDIAPPKTYQEFLDACEKLKNSGVTPIYDAGKDGWPLQIFYMASWPSMVGTTLPADFGDKASRNEVDYTTIAPFVDLFKRQVELIEKGYYNKDLLSGTYNSQQEAFGSGKAAFLFQGDWVAADLNKKFPDLKYGVLPVPSDSGDNYASLGDPNAVGIWSGSKKIDLAKKYLAFLAEPESLKTWYAANGGVPSLKTVDVAPLAGFEELYETAKSGKNGKFLSGSEIGYPSFVPMLQELISMQKSPEQTVKSFQEMTVKEGKNLGLTGF